MTTTPEETRTDADRPELVLGRGVVRRMRLPGRPIGQPLPTRIGSLASSVSRFAAATSRPVDIRRALAGPGPQGMDGSSAPPRWWRPTDRETADAPGAPQPPAWLAPARPVAIRRLPERGLPRAAHAVPDESSWSPGGILGGLRAEVVRVRRLDEVTAVGPMLTQTDRTKLNAGMAARAASVRAGGTPAPPSTPPNAAPHSTPSVPALRRSTTRAPRSPSPSAPPAPAASEPPPSAEPDPTPAAAATPPTAATPAPATPAPAPSRSGSESGAASAASAPMATPAPAPAPVRRAIRPRWQLRADGSRFDRLVRRSAARRPGAPARPAPSHALPATVPTLATAEHQRPALAADGERRALETGVRPPEVVRAAGPALIAASSDAPATLRRQAWAGGSIVVRQAGDPAERSIARRIATPARGAVAAAAATTARPTTASRQPAAAPAAAAPSPVVPSAATYAETAAATPTAPAPTARAAEPVIRRLPSSTATPIAPSVESSVESSAAQPSGSTHARSSEAAAPDLRRLPRLWRGSSVIRPSLDLGAATPAPGLKVDGATSAVPATASPPGSSGASPAATAAVTTGPAPTSPNPTAGRTQAASLATSAGAVAVRRLPAPGDRLAAPAAHLAGAEVGMAELLTIRRAPVHGTDASRPLATGFSAPDPIRPASPVAASPVAASPVAASSVATSHAVAGAAGPVAAGEHRLWRRPRATGTAASARPAASTLRRLVASAVAGTASVPTVEGRRMPASRTPAPTTPAAATTATGPVTGWSTAASAPASEPGRAVRRLTVAPPRISIAPAAAPAVPAVAADLAGPGASPTGGGAPAGTGGPETLRRSTGGGSLVDATAHLFGTEDSVVRRALGGDTTMPPDAPPPPQPQPAGSVPAIYGSSLVSDPGRQDQPDFAMHPDAPPPGVAFDALVDAVVERIEQRVVEELERRGRWHGRGGF